MLTAQDNGEPGRTCTTAESATQADTFRIAITGPISGVGAEAKSALVYDNMVNSAETGVSPYAGTCISGGNIKIHQPKRRVLRGDSSK
jgi:hypothetical protein